MRVVLGRLFLVLLVVFGVLIAMMAAGRIEAPSRFDPFAPLVVDEPPNWLTALKFARVRRDADLCRRVLNASSAIAVSAVPDRSTGENCGFADAVRIERTNVPLTPAAPTTTCGLAAAWAMFERHVLEQAAQETLGARVARVEHAGVYACRNVYGRANARRSEHASANAIDISAFVLSDGRRVDLRRDWASTTQPAKAAFLRRARDGACGYFNVVLGPEYNAAHRDHFHFDMGRARVCR